MPSRVNALLTFDLRLSRRLTAWGRSTPVRWGATVLAHSGDATLWAVVGIAAWFLSAGAWRSAGLHVVGIVVAAGAFSALAKSLIRRPRPGGTQGFFYSNFDPHSFPSGHATRVGALVMALSPWLPWPGRALFAGWAVAVCLSRVALGLHFLGDVAGGLLFGAGIGAMWHLLFG